MNEEEHLPQTKPISNMEHSEFESMKQIKDLLKSAFSILPEEIYFPEDHKIQPDLITAYEEHDRAIQYEVDKILNTITKRRKNFVIQRLGLAHAIHNIPILMTRGFDHYLAQIKIKDYSKNFFPA
ncbi:MAG TPA: hypothetical protein VJH96_03950 [Patescibacteria group bacterium]|nr:hypothetical protein [Patescibacteria group bacterium]